MHIYILPQCSTTAARLLNPAGTSAQFERSKCAISGGILTELTAEILHTFIQRIEVGARAEKKARHTTQEIRIIYRDIGILDDIPETLDGIELYEQKTIVA